MFDFSNAKRVSETIDKLRWQISVAVCDKNGKKWWMTYRVFPWNAS
jgi:hypothetical protein